MKVIVAVLLLSVSLAAQEPVRPVPDIISWGTALTNPTIAAVQAFRSEDRLCRFGQLGISGGITTTVGLLAQHYLHSPRPCVGSPGCSGNGDPSMHAAIGVLGLSRGFQSGLGLTFSISLAVGTAAGRVDARRHDPKQAAFGLVLGGLSELAGRTLLRCQG